MCDIESDTIDKTKFSFGLFVGHTGPALSFGLKISDENIKNQLIFSIQKSHGRIEKDLNSLKSYSIILTDEKSYRDGLFDRIAFKYNYVFDCIANEEILPLGKYSFCPQVHNEDFFDVIYYQTKEFEIIDSPSVAVNLPKYNRYDKLDIQKSEVKCINSLDDDDGDGFIPKKNVQASSSYNRENRKPYTRGEKEAILKYIIRNGKLVGLRGNPLWIKMEKARVCQNRTWQSLKNHFLKTLVRELDSYPFLTFEVKELMRGNSG